MTIYDPGGSWKASDKSEMIQLGPKRVEPLKDQVTVYKGFGL